MDSESFPPATLKRDAAAEIARQVAGTLRPGRVLDLSDDPTLRGCLREREIAVWEAPDDAVAYDLTLYLAAIGDAAGAASFMAARTRHAPLLLLALHPSRRIAGSGELTLHGWLDAAAAGGLVPVPGYDSSFLGADAVLLERRDAADVAAWTPALRDAFVEIVRARHSLAWREQAMGQRAGLLRDRLERSETQRRKLGADGSTLARRLREAEAALAVARHERDALRNSTIWRVTAPLRRLLDRVHRGRGVAAAGGPKASAYRDWVARCDTLDDAARGAIRDAVARMVDPPLISVLMPAYDTPAGQLRAAIASVQAQLYPHWELCVADDASPSPEVAGVLADVAAREPRLRWVRCAVNGNISAATNAALALATGTFVALMDHDDLLPEHALYEIAAEIGAHPDVDVIYSDEDQIDDGGERALPYFKPDFNIELMLGHNMVSHLGVYRRELVERLGGARLGLEGSQDYDLALRAVAATMPARIRHIPRVLYHWRQHRSSFSQSRTDTCVAAARRAIGDYLTQTGQMARVAEIGPSPSIPTWTRVRWAVPVPAPKVSMIVPTRDGAAMLRACADGLLQRTDYPDTELIIVDNGSELAETEALLRELQRDMRVRVLRYPGAFNYSAMNNAAAQLATGPLLALVNNDIDVIEPGWLTEMVSQALRPGIGAVGARLLYADDRIQHVGVVLGVGTFDGGPGVAGHYSLAEPGGNFGYFGASVLVHEVAAVTAACMVVTRAAFDAVGGLDAEHLPVAFNDVDFCLRLRERGLRNIFTPYAELYHRESATRGDDLAPEHRARFDGECRYMRERWGATLDADPFYNPNFSRMDGLFGLGDV